MSSDRTRAAPRFAHVERAYRTYAPRLERVLVRLRVPAAEVPELLHAVFLVALENPNALPLDGTTAFKWLGEVARRLARNRARRFSVRFEVSHEGLDHYPGDAAPVNTIEARQSVRLGLEQIPRSQDREILLLRWMEGRKWHEIAALHGTSESNAFFFGDRARKRFIEAFQWMDRDPSTD